MSGIVLTADSTCDLTRELSKRYDVKGYTPLHIVMGEKSYEDGVNINPPDIYKNFEATGTLPKTSAVNVGEYLDFFKKFTDKGLSVIHINLGSALSSTHQNAVAAAAQLENVYPIDSCNLSSGSGHLVIEASKLIAEGKLSAKEIAERVKGMTPKVHVSFVIDKLDYLRAGGRCSTLAMLGANLLRIKPSIFVDNKDGSMTVGKKYRGKLEKVVPQYTREKLAQYTNFDSTRAFIVSRNVSPDIVNSMCEIVESLGAFNEILTSEASCVITSHCGPGTLGVLYIEGE